MASFKLTSDQQKDYSEVMRRFESHFVIRKNPIYERARFNSRIQEENESVDSFVTALHTLSEHCEYQILREELIRDRLIVGLRNRKLSESLQMNADLTLSNAVEKARQSEEIKKQQSVLFKDSSQLNTSDVNKIEARQIRKYEKPKETGKPFKNNYVRNKVNSSVNKDYLEGRCNWCGKTPSHKRINCPAKEKQCLNCNKKGHYATVCRYKKNIATVESELEEPFFIGKIINNGNTLKDKWTVNIEIGRGGDLDFKIDTGTDVSVLPYSWFKANKPKGKFEMTRKKLQGPEQTNLDVIGKINTNLKYKNVEKEHEIYIVKELKNALLGKPAIEEFNLIQRIYNIEISDVIKEYPRLFSGLGLIGEYKIRLKPDAIPYAVYTPRRVPIPTMQALKTELDRMVEQQVITPIQEPTEWCAPMVIAPKARGKIRICVDLTQLNKSVLREHHPLPAVEHILAQMPGARVFSKLDANSGFWQIKLEEESRKLTTFISPFGRYHFNRLPFGITSAPECFQRIMSNILEGLEGVVCLTDDILVWGVNQQEHDTRLRKTLEKLQSANVTLNKDKSQFSVSKVKFLGHVIDREGVHPDPEKVNDIKCMRPPKNIEELRRFIGLVNYLAKFTPNMADKMQPLSCLLKKESMWYWGGDQEKAFKLIKEMLCSNAVLALYDPRKETIIATDASSYGLGAVLSQKQDNGKTRPVAYASRTLTPTERRYAQIEKECLGIVWGCERLRDLLIGKQFHVETDHKPLISILTKKQLDELSPRLQRLKMRMMRYNYTVSHIPGKKLVAADALSRAPASEIKEEDKELSEEIKVLIRQVVQDIPASDKKVEEIRQEQKKDRTLKIVYNYCKYGWPKKDQIDPEVKEYWKVNTELAAQEGLLMRNNRLAIPKSMRAEMLKLIHEGHMGISKCRERAKSSVWWPGISREIKDKVTKCSRCIQHRTNPMEPLKPSQFPSKPWECVGMDLFYWQGKWWILMTDYYSRFPEVAQLPSLKSSTVINFMKTTFARHGIPKILRSDNGPQFQVIRNSEFATYAREEGFLHITSSPRYPKSNGLIEASVKTVKDRLKKSEDPQAALLAYRNTPLENGFSPSQLLMGRRLRSKLPVAESQLEPKWPDFKELQEREEKLRGKGKVNYDLRHRTRSLSELHPEEKVWITDLKRPGRIISPAETPRSYLVETEKGTRVRRNRYHLIPDPKAEVPEEEPEEGLYTEERKEEGVKKMENTEEKEESKNRKGIYTKSGRLVKPPQRLDL